MIAVKIEKEIRQENRIFGNFNFRQAGCFLIAAIIEIIFFIIVRPEIEVAMFLGMNLGIVAWYFGFHKKDNIYMEYFMWKKIKTYMLRNDVRRYKTKNKYISMMNQAYSRDRQEDLSDKFKKKEIAKREKILKKKKKKCSAKAYA